MRLQVENLSFSYGEKQILHNINLCVGNGEFIGVIGPNGSGKSTLLKNLYRSLLPDSGQVLLDGKNLLSMRAKEAAQKFGVLGQENEVVFDFTVEEMVIMGRTPYKKLFSIDTSEDHKIVQHALAHVGMEGMANRNFARLSGGEKQRVLFARIIAQQTDFLFLDEPTNHLDISYQIQLFDFVKRLNFSVLCAMHDLNMAALYCDRIYVLKEGQVFATGAPQEVLTPAMLLDVFGIYAQVEQTQDTNKVHILFKPETSNSHTLGGLQ